MKILYSGQFTDIVIETIVYEEALMLTADYVQDCLDRQFL